MVERGADGSDPVARASCGFSDAEVFEDRHGQLAEDGEVAIAIEWLVVVVDYSQLGVFEAI